MKRMNTEQKTIIDKIIRLTASIDPNGAVWGYDTEICQVDELREDVFKLIKEMKI